MSYVLDVRTRRLSENGTRIPLRTKCADLLTILAHRPHQTVSKSELIDCAWGADSDASDATLAQHICLLRKALGGGAMRHPFIETVPRIGYRFVGCVMHETGTVIFRSVEF